MKYGLFGPCGPLFALEFALYYGLCAEFALRAIDRMPVVRALSEGDYLPLYVGIRCMNAEADRLWNEFRQSPVVTADQLQGGAVAASPKSSPVES